MKAGSIIARKYTRRLSAMQTLNDNYLLDIFVPKNNGKTKSTGMLYFDDGESFDSTSKDKYSLVEIIFEDGNLSLNVIKSNYISGQSFTIDEINLFGVERVPLRASIEYPSISSNGREVTMMFDEAAKQIEIRDLNIHMLNDANNGAPILRVHFTEEGTDNHQTQYREDF